ncbi:hypothetical protein E2C01_048201 [Portunus trituberculatus]|uniref:Uncharacterized protein n=1 Tax=Portunus trituberculatus TaxID=210409 RepID=A0A5B7G325_PORTR|nr:hypothetical protein [Portunus trituberculatus]
MGYGKKQWRVKVVLMVMKDIDSTVMVARGDEDGRYAVSKIRRAVSMKIAVKDNERCSFVTVKKEAKDSQSEEKS